MDGNRNIVFLIASKRLHILFFCTFAQPNPEIKMLKPFLFLFIFTWRPFNIQTWKFGCRRFLGGQIYVLIFSQKSLGTGNPYLHWILPTSFYCSDCNTHISSAYEFFFWFYRECQKVVTGIMIICILKKNNFIILMCLMS